MNEIGVKTMTLWTLKHFGFSRDLGMRFFAIRAAIAAATILPAGIGPNGVVSQGIAQENTRTGAVVGGLTGAAIGGVIGHNKKKQTAEGVLIGGAVGAVAGGLMGNQRDRNLQQQRAYQQQQAYYNHTPYGYAGQPTVVYSSPVYGAPPVYRDGYRANPAPRTTTRRPVTMAEVINMTRSGVSDTVIVSHIQTNGVASRPDVNDVILLSQEGVSDYVITAMQGGVPVASGTVAPGVVTVPAYPTTTYPATTYPIAPSYREARSPQPLYAPPRSYDRRGF